MLVGHQWTIAWHGDSGNITPSKQIILTLGEYITHDLTFNLSDTYNHLFPIIKIILFGNSRLDD